MEDAATMILKSESIREYAAEVYCPICTHIVQAVVVSTVKKTEVKPGQKCEHCRSSIDAGYVMRYPKAA
jgi:transcription elongation factor Elf1